MSFQNDPQRYLRFARTSRDPYRDSAAIELPDPPDKGGHRWIPIVCLLAGLVVLVILAMERFV